MKQFLYIGIFLAFFCCKDDNSYKFSMEGKDRLWLFCHYVNKSNQERITLPEGYTAEIRFGDGQCICLNGPCNSGEGVYRIVGDNNLSFEGFALTERGYNLLGLKICRWIIFLGYIPIMMTPCILTPKTSMTWFF